MLIISVMIRDKHCILKIYNFSAFSEFKSGLTSGGHIRPGPDKAGYENLARFRPGPAPDMISGATLGKTVDVWF